MSNIIFMSKEEAEKDDNIILYDSLDKVKFKVGDEAIKKAARRIERKYRIK